MKQLKQLLLLSVLRAINFRADATTYFVNVSNSVPLAPYTNWPTAATNIQSVIDADGDGMNNWQEWIAGSIPTNAASVLILNPPTNAVTGLQVSWPSVNTRMYYIQHSTNLLAAPAFTAIQSNLTGGTITTTFTDTSATNGGPYFYRIGVQ